MGFRIRRRRGIHRLRTADRVHGLFEWQLWSRLAAFEGKKLGWRSNFSALGEDRIGEVEHLGPENRILPTDKDQHLAGGDNSFGFAVPFLYCRLKAEDFIWRHEWPLDLIHARVDMSHYRRQS